MKEEIKVLNEVLADKRKYERARTIIIVICITLIIIFGLAFYTGAITWHFGR
jgi:hypothetical protein